MGGGAGGEGARAENSICHFPASCNATCAPAIAGSQTAQTDVFWGKGCHAQPTCKLLIQGHYLNNSEVSFTS